tara:strand:- start:906 stop:1289 length:384 start_codon:yes stop_codon:yes gene_type:complete
MNKELSYQECINQGWEMTGDGFWFKEETSEESGTKEVEYAPDNEYIDNVLIEELMKPTITLKKIEAPQFAWQSNTSPEDTKVSLIIEEYETLCQLVFEKIKDEYYQDDETSISYNILLGKLLILANQ